jgi:hypothetical protein
VRILLTSLDASRLRPAEPTSGARLSALAAGCVALGVRPYSLPAQSRLRLRKAETRQSLKASAFDGRADRLTSLRRLYCPARLALASFASAAPGT